MRSGSGRRCTRYSSRSARSGKGLPPDRLEQSELILPPADASMDEVRSMLRDEGLIPD